MAAVSQQQLPLAQYNHGLYQGQGDTDSDSEEYQEIRPCCGAQYMDTNAEAQAKKFTSCFNKGCMARVLHWCCLLAVSFGALSLGLEAWSAMRDADVQTYSALAWGSFWGSFVAWCVGLLAVAFCALVVVFLSACGIPWQRYTSGRPARLAKAFIVLAVIGASVMVALLVALYVCNQRARLPVVSAANLVCQDETVWHCGRENSSEIWSTVDVASDDRPDNGVAAVAKWYLTSGDVPGPVGVCERMQYLCDPPFNFDVATSCVCNGLSVLAPTTTVTTTTTYTSTTTPTTVTTMTVTETTATESLTFTTLTTGTTPTVTGTTLTLTRVSATATATTVTTTRTSITKARPQITITWTTSALSTQQTTSALSTQQVSARRLSEWGSGADLARTEAAAPGSLSAWSSSSSSSSSSSLELPGQRMLMAVAPAPWEGHEGAYCDVWSVAADEGEAEVITHPTALSWCFVNPGMRCGGDVELQDSPTYDGYNASFIRSSGPCTSSVSSRSRVVEHGHTQVNDALWPLGFTALMALLTALSCGVRLMVLPPGEPVGEAPADTPVRLKFEMAEREVEALVDQSTPQEVTLKLYGLHKQAYHGGPRGVREPSGNRFSSKKTWEQQKYDAWKKYGSYPMEQAMAEYIKTVEKYKESRTKRNQRDKDSGGGCFLN
jgi:acyl-CoA-binding protein